MSTDAYIERNYTFIKQVSGGFRFAKNGKQPKSRVFKSKPAARRYLKRLLKEMDSASKTIGDYCGV